MGVVQDGSVDAPLLGRLLMREQVHLDQRVAIPALRRVEVGGAEGVQRHRIARCLHRHEVGVASHPLEVRCLCVLERALEVPAIVVDLRAKEEAGGLRRAMVRLGSSACGLLGEGLGLIGVADPERGRAPLDGSICARSTASRWASETTGRSACSAQEAGDSSAPTISMLSRTVSGLGSAEPSATAESSNRRPLRQSC